MCPTLPEESGILAQCLFRVMLAGVGIGSFFEPFPIALGVFNGYATFS